MQSSIDSICVAQQVKGITAAVMLPSGEIWTGVSGVSHAATPVTPDMLFGIGSNTKLFTAIAVLKLSEAGLLALDDSIYHWIPTTPNIDSCITIRQLLNHTSGLAGYNQIPGYNDSILSNPNRIFSKTELLSWVGAPVFAPGTSWGYCNTNYLLAGMIAESVASQPLEEYLRQNIFTPFQLDSTFFPVYDTLIGATAHAWVNGTDIDPIPRASTLSSAWSAGAIYSTAVEMVQWYHTLFSGALLSPTSFNEMTTPVGPTSYGMGMSRQVINGRVVWGHTGNIRGYLSCFVYDTLTGICVTVIINQDPSSPVPVVATLLNIAAGTLLSAKPLMIGDSLFVIHPNPLHGKFNVTSSLFHFGESWTLDWFDASGRWISKDKLIASDNHLTSYSALRSGSYLLQLTNDSNSGYSVRLKAVVE